MPSVVWTAVALLASGDGLAQTPPDYGYQWSTINHAGNRAVSAADYGGQPPANKGRVDYEYRMARTEITIGQWFEFVQAYSPYYTGSPQNTDFSGFGIEPTSQHPTGPNDWRLVAPWIVNEPTTMGWRFAARYCNWLTNGKTNTAAAFERGAYDTSTFSTNPDHTFNDQIAHSPGATFWIPTQDEWDKAMYFDPNRHGTGAEGYWFYPIVGADRNHPPISGYPGEGGQTNCQILDDDYRLIPVGSYPDSMSSFGMFDGSGGVAEWTESVRLIAGDLPEERYVRGSHRSSVGGTILDALFVDLSDRPDNSVYTGFRLASIVPSPGALASFAMFAAVTLRRRLRIHA